MASDREQELYSIRGDLEYSTLTQKGQSFVVVKDPVRERYFRFPESQAAILELLRDPIDLETLARRASGKLGAEVPAATLLRFIDSLQARLLIDTPAARAGHEPRERNWLYMRLASFDAQALFDWLAPRVAWCFTPAFHAFAIFMILTGIAITTIHAGTLVRDALSLLNLYGIILIFLVVVVVGVLHELAHGLTCRHFGGKVKELGFMLIYFQPAFYCDVSDSWMFPSRRERMWVTFAGGYFQLVLWGMAAVVWRIFAEDTLINWIATTVIVFSGLQTLVNFNPLIKLDGYYMLSDYLEIPNLRAKALQALRSWVAGGADPLLVSGDRGSLLTFGALSMTFSTLLLAVVYVNIYILATSYFAFAGLTAFVLFAGFTLRRTGVEPAAGARALVKRANLKKYRNLGIAAILVLLTFIVPWTLRIPAEFTIRPGQQFQVRATTDGMIEEIVVRESDKVHASHPLAYIYNSRLHQQHTELQRLFDSSQSNLDQLEEGTRQEEILRLQLAVATRQQELENASRNTGTRNAMESELRSLEAALRQGERRAGELATLVEEGLAARGEADDAREEVNIARGQYDAMVQRIASFDETNASEVDLRRRRLEEAEQELELARAGARPQEIEQARKEASNYYAQMMVV